MPSHCRGGLARLRLEPLESRCLLSVFPWNQVPALTEVEPNDTLDHAQVLGPLAGQVAVTGAIGNGAAAAFEKRGRRHRRAPVRWAMAPSHTRSGVSNGTIADLGAAQLGVPHSESACRE